MLQLVFVALTNILLITSLISLLSNSLTKVRKTPFSRLVLHHPSKRKWWSWQNGWTRPNIITILAIAWNTNATRTDSSCSTYLRLFKLENLYLRESRVGRRGS